ncbi:MAG: hypothetical protein SPH62_01205, partial [Candidatus Egerieousia sp.]|nr:hypothetical protein [bacterium]MDY5255017.1 hypothetical protein [Candidatus Egerieousia sp.]
KSGFLCAFGVRNPRFRAFRAQNRGFCALLPAGRAEQQEELNEQDELDKQDEPNELNERDKQDKKNGLVS